MATSVVLLLASTSWLSRRIETAKKRSEMWLNESMVWLGG